MADTIINWLCGLVKTIPEDIIKTLILGFIILVIRIIINKVKCLNFRFKHFMEKILSTNIEISTETFLINSPEYIYPAKRKETYVHSPNSSDNDVWGSVILVIVIASIIINFFKEYAEHISLFLKWFGLIPLIFSIIFLFIIAVSKEVQKVTVKFILVSIVVSTLTLYYGLNIKEMTETMSSSIVDTRNFYISLYKILAVLIGFIQQMIAYILLLRVFSVYIDRKKKKPIQAIRKYISKTKKFESVPALVTLVIVFSVLSCLLTSEGVHNFLIR